MNKAFFLLLIFAVLLSFVSVNSGIYYVISHTVEVSIFVLLLIWIIQSLKNSEKEENISLKEFILVSTLAFYQPLHFYALNLSEMNLSMGVLICLSVYLSFLLMFLIINFLLRNKNKSLLLAIVFVFISLNFFGNILLVSLVGIFLFYLISKINVYNTRKGLVVFSSVLLLMNFVTLGQNLYKINLSKQNFTKTEDLSKFVNGKSDKNRDIYIIVLDMYSGTDMLKEKWNFDNSEFINFLKGKGFHVFDKMYSNYNITFSSIPTMTNFDYLERMNYDCTSKALNDAPLFKIAKYNGYKTIFEKNFYFTINSPYIDYVYEDTYTKNPLNIIVTFFKNSFYAELVNRHFLYELCSPKIKFNSYPNIREKKFVFMHYLMPHTPYLYDENGKPVEPVNYENIDDNYLPYLRYTNKLVTSLVEELFTTENFPVIIITGDHGMRHADYFDSYFSTFTAYFNPERQYSHVKNSKTLINFFINFTNYEFNLKIPEQKDKIIYTEHFINGIDADEYTIIDRINKYGKDVTKRFIK